MEAIGYIRISTQGQEDKFGKAAQRTMIENHAKENGFEIVEWLEDTISGVEEDRPSFNKILYSDDYKNKTLIVAKTDRIARDMQLFYYYKMLIGKKNIKLISVNDDFSQFGDFSGILEAFVLFVAEQERKNITIRTSGGRNTKAKTGKYSGGKAPYGYKVENGLLVIYENECKVLKMMIELENQGMNYSQIKNYLNENNIKTRTGSIWQNITVSRILKNKSFYKGNYKYGNCPSVNGFHESII